MTAKADDQFQVYLYDQPIARLLRHQDYTRFIFDKAYVNDAERPVLGLRFEENLNARYASNMRLPSWFSNLLPEGRLREWVALARSVSVDREMELLAQLGHDLPGAVRVLRADEVFPEDSTDHQIIGRAALKSDPSAALWRFSLAGVGLKFSMLGNGDRFTAPGSGGGGDWIIKLPDLSHPHVPHNEFAMMSLARAAGIEVPDIKLVHRSRIEPLPDSAWAQAEEYAYAVRRFDRADDGSLIHIEDLAQVRGFYPDDKYSGSFETIGALVYRGHDVRALHEFGKRLALNVLIGNGDAHLKNWSLIYPDRRMPTLAPAYDIVATSSYRPQELGPEDLGLRFGGSKRFESVRLSTFAAMDQRLNANCKLSDVVASFVEAVLANRGVVSQILDACGDLGGRTIRLIETRAQQFIG